MDAASLTPAGVHEHERSLARYPQSLACLWLAHRMLGVCGMPTGPLGQIKEQRQSPVSG